MAFKKLKLWFDGDLAILLAEKIHPIQKGFDGESFAKQVDAGVGELELKARVELMADLLGQFLGGGYPANIKVLLQIMGPENEQETGMFTEYYWLMPVAKYVEKYGLDDFELSMQAIEEITKRNTGEYTIRPYFEKYPDKALGKMLTWAQNEKRHVRRLASEGIRPRLPWAPKLQSYIDDPEPILPILQLLKDDPSKYVQKSVANCINDILKDNFPIGKALIEEWAQAPSKQRAWIIKHAIRNYRKKEDPWALKLERDLLNAVNS